MRNGSEPERWASAQCLAHAGVCDSYIVSELIQQLLGSEDMIKSERCVSLMARLSSNSTIVHSMVGEQLNSTSWRQRIIACRVLPRLNGVINKVSDTCLHWRPHCLVNHFLGRLVPCLYP